MHAYIEVKNLNTYLHTYTLSIMEGSASCTLSIMEGSASYTLSTMEGSAS